MSEVVKPQEGRSMMGEVSSTTGQVGGAAGFKAAGLYRHKESGEELHLTVDPLLGDGQVRAFERAGFEYVRPTEPGEIVYTTPSHNSAAEAQATNDALLRDILARQTRLEEENARLRASLGDAAPAAPATTTEPEKTEAEKVSETQTETAEVVDASKSRSELEELATAAGLTDLAQYNTKDKLAEAINAKNAEAKEGTK